MTLRTSHSDPAGVPAEDAATEACEDACEVVALHSLSWLVAGCAVGLLQAVLLLAPEWGRLLTPWSYGRWATVHLDINLYGWCSMPLIGLLFSLYLPRTRRAGWAVAAVGVWSGMLLLAVIGWLCGHNSGKLFMEWAGPSRVAVAAGMAFLALALGLSYRQRLAEGASGTLGGAAPESAWTRRGKWLLLALLATIPALMYELAGTAHFPPVNPDSGGATGGSLLGSALVVIVIFWATPFILGLPRATPLRAFRPGAALLALHLGLFALLDHGNRSHHEPVQLVALGSLVVWLPLLIAHFRRFTWPARSTAWLAAFCAWGALLLATALATFMPDLLERLKFTNALVAHSHIAMAGMITNFNILVLLAITRHSGLVTLFYSRRAFVLWQSGLAVHVAALFLASALEIAHPDWLFRGHPALLGCYAARLAGGGLMILAAAHWWRRAHALRYALEQPGARRAASAPLLSAAEPRGATV